MSDRRQAVLGATALALAGFTGISFRRARTGAPETVPIPSAPGFRRLAATGGPGEAALTVGLDTGGRASALPARTEREICEALIREGGPGVPVAAFTDYRCPTCPALGPRLSGLGGPPLAITWHEWPILGPASEFAARLALAASMQAPHALVHAHLMRRRPRPSREGLVATAEALGLDAARLGTDMDRPVIRSRLRQSAALAARFGFRGTPSLVVGRVALEGLPTARLLRQFVAEADAAPRCHA